MTRLMTFIKEAESKNEELLVCFDRYVLLAKEKLTITSGQAYQVMVPSGLSENLSLGPNIHVQ